MLPVVHHYLCCQLLALIVILKEILNGLEELYIYSKEEIKAQFPVPKESQTEKLSDVLNKKKPDDGKDAKKKKKQTEEQLKAPDKSAVVEKVLVEQQALLV
ncbi:unnamed protein product [Brugia timori]|uniref:Uncharacterized protein n=2 Tax=Brugia TaxID=6278 RepID=A8PHZ0_BRUMA|nr:unnamed protein product [Brugia timori]